ncbi:CHAT domain-containing protein [Cupriavidus basilensis]
MALGPLLAQAGAPAVLAMQGNVSVATMDAFMPVFFTELRDHGDVDRAAGIARAAVGQQPDWWMPAVFTRLDSGRIFIRRASDPTKAMAPMPGAPSSRTSSMERPRRSSDRP